MWFFYTQKTEKPGWPLSGYGWMAGYSFKIQNRAVPNSIQVIWTEKWWLIVIFTDNNFFYNASMYLVAGVMQGTVATFCAVILRSEEAKPKLSYGKTLISSVFKYTWTESLKLIETLQGFLPVFAEHRSSAPGMELWCVSHIFSACTLCAHIDFYPWLSWNRQEPKWSPKRIHIFFLMRKCWAMMLSNLNYSLVFTPWLLKLCVMVRAEGCECACMCMS